MVASLAFCGGFHHTDGLNPKLGDNMFVIERFSGINC